MTNEHIQMWREKAKLQAENIELRFELAKPMIKEFDNAIKSLVNTIQILKDENNTGS